MSATANLPTGSDDSATFDVNYRSERCFLTKSFRYTHISTHWARAPGRKKAEVEQKLINLGIVGDCFDLDGPTNLVRLDLVVHKSVQSDDLIAITGTSETLKELAKMVKEDNDKRQRHFDEHGTFLPRQLDLNNPTFLEPQYELVALHPERLLPAKSVLVRYDPARLVTHQTYVPSPDRRLRESPGDLTCAPFPPFSGPDRQPGSRLNPFLVILNARAVFTSYFNSPSPRQALPMDVLELMSETAGLVDLIYWKPGVVNRCSVNLEEYLNKDLDLEARDEEMIALLTSLDPNVEFTERFLRSIRANV